ncbi:hypothetical protein MRBBS_0894 [Marinobacter sp. BSs20148]|nr:hypothetical protein MRBBS_0894 [Marinobacter sp. BSs20148]
MVWQFSANSYDRFNFMVHPFMTYLCPSKIRFFLRAKLICVGT